MAEEAKLSETISCHFGRHTISQNDTAKTALLEYPDGNWQVLKVNFLNHQQKVRKKLPVAEQSTRIKGRPRGGDRTLYYFLHKNKPTNKSKKYLL